MTEETFILRKIPAGSLIKRVDVSEFELRAFLEWEEPDNSLHVMRVTPDAFSPAGFRVDEDSVHVAPDFEMTVGLIGGPHSEPRKPD